MLCNALVNVQKCISQNLQGLLLQDFANVSLAQIN